MTIPAKFKLDTESRSLLYLFRVDKRRRVVTAYRTRDINKLDKAVGRYNKAEWVDGRMQISQKYY